MILFFFSHISTCCTCVVSDLHLANPCVDQESLSRTGGAAQHSLAQQGGVLWNGQWVKIFVQALLAAGPVPFINLVQNTLTRTGQKYDLKK